MKKNIKNKIIKEIYNVRSKNNLHWMQLLDLAMKSSPKETKIILSNINKFDKKISLLLKKLSK